MCGINPVLVLLEIARKNGWNTHLLKYANSGDVTGDTGGVVGYAAIAFYAGKKEEKKIKKEVKKEDTKKLLDVDKE